MKFNFYLIIFNFQKMPANQLVDLENRQDKLLKQLDILYERIQKISSLCVSNPSVKQETKINAIDIVSDIHFYKYNTISIQKIFTL